MSITQLLLPMLAQMGLTFALYPVLTWARARAVRRGVDGYGAYELTDGEDRLAGRISANLRNQFEAPVLFYAVIFGLITLRAGGYLAVILAWTFVAGRVLHSAVQIAMGDVRLRGLVFVVNFLALVGLWALLVLRVLGG